jgi:hypothetical protein
MKRSLGLSLVFVLMIPFSVQAAISLRPNDTVTFEQQTSGLSTGYGGLFTWQVASTAPRTDGSTAPAVGTSFYSFCAQIGGSGSTISAGNTYTITSFITPVVGQAINAGGNTLVNTQGLFLFDQWSAGNIAQNQSDAAAIQVALWLSEGYTSSAIESTAGYSSSQFSAAQSQESSLLSSLGYSSAWQVGTNDKVAILNGAQDQFVSCSTSTSSVPEPASFVIWGIVSLAGAATVIGKKAIKGRKPTA